MNLLDKTTKAGNEIEINACFQKRGIAIPFFVSWWSSSHKSKDNQWMSAKEFDIHFLCFSLHFTYWKWSNENGSER